MKRLRNGVKCYIIPKTGFAAREMMLAVNYGALDNGAAEAAGTAHYLEHKMFEGRRGHAFARFAQLGADVNAFTNQTTTAYYANCDGGYEDCLKALLATIDEPYFTDDNVEKERPIIEREIRMYDDDPYWVGRLDLCGAMFAAGHPAADNIAGTAQTIAPITPKRLYEAYDAHYSPENRTLVCVGDMDPETVYAIADGGAVSIPPSLKAGSPRPVDASPVTKPFIRRQMGLAAPVFHIGLKETDFETPFPLRKAAAQIALDAAIGQGSEAYAALYDSGDADDTAFGAAYEGSLWFGYGLAAGASPNPQRVFEAFRAACLRLKRDGLAESDFDRLRRKHMGRYARVFNAIHGVAALQADLSANGTDILEMANALSAVAKTDVDKRLAAFDDNRLAMSVIE